MVTVAASLIRELLGICGSAGVISDPQRLMVYECDAYTLEKHLPDIVVLPRSTEEVVAVIRVCATHQMPIIPRGAGTSLSGAVLAVDGGVVIATTRLNRILHVDHRNRRALVEAGVPNLWISNAVKDRGLTFVPDPSSQPSCTIAGNIAFNAGGPHTLKYGATTNHVLGFDLVLPSGERVWLGTKPDGGEDVGGYDLRGVVIGAEGMMGVTTQVLVRLIKAPRAYRTVLCVFESTDAASCTVSDIIAAGIIPVALELMDQPITRAIEEGFHVGLPLDAGAVLIVELDGHEAGLDRQLERVMEICRKNGVRELRPARSDQERADLWKCRKRAFGAIGRISPCFVTQDAVVPRTRLPEIMRYIYDIAGRHGCGVANVCHAGDGNIHPIIFYDERIPGDEEKAFSCVTDIVRQCLALGGSVTGEHGIGVEKTELMAEQYTADDLDAMRRVRRAFDPEGRCNPHKMFPGGKRCLNFHPKRQIVP
jgi:glycolate oxidase